MTLGEYMAREGVKDAELAAEFGIARSYVTRIRNGGRQPGMALALRIHRKIGLKLGPLAGATKSEIAAVERVTERAA
jgi:transcriptional regulator with XRE-family HTH domain